VVRKSWSYADCEISAAAGFETCGTDLVRPNLQGDNAADARWLSGQLANLVVSAKAGLSRNRGMRHNGLVTPALQGFEISRLRFYKS